MGPLFAPEGTVTIIWLSVQEVGVALTGGKGPVWRLNPPEKLRVPVAAPKSLPVIVIVPPVVVASGEIVEITGMVAWCTAKLLVE